MPSSTPDLTGKLSPTQLLEAHKDDVAPDLPPPENKRFYPALDGLRAIAVLMVFYHHYLDHPVILNWGWAGVDVFFVLSGFLITGILYDTRNAAHRFRNFYVRRTLRIFPLYYAVLLVALLLTPVFHWVWHPVWYLWPIYLGNFGRFIWLHDYQTNSVVMDHLLSSDRQFDPPLVFFLGHFWSLCVEEQFYLVWPFFVFLIKDRVKLRNICVAIFFLVFLARIACVLYVPKDLIEAGFIERFTPLRVDALLLGGFVALCLRGQEGERVKGFALPVMWTCFGAYLAMQVFSFVTVHQPYRMENWWSGVCIFGYPCIDLFSAGLILRTIEPGTLFFRLLSNSLFRRLGQISYGFYVFHDIFHVTYQKLVRHVFGANVPHVPLVVAAVALCGTTLLAYLSFRFFEAPFLRLKERFTV